MESPVVNIIHKWERTDRLDSIKTQFKDIPHIIWTAKTHPQAIFIGIKQSHQQIVANAKFRGLPYVCIAEDDCVFTAPGAWEHYLKNMPEDFDLYLSGIYCGYIGENNIVPDFCALTLYICHERFYDRFLAIETFGNFDRNLANFGIYKVCVPFATVQLDGYSDNKMMYEEYGKFITANNYKLFKGFQ